MKIKKILYTPRFVHTFKKIPVEIKNLAAAKEKIFMENPFDARLKTHKLKGVMRDYWAFSISYQCRIGFTFAGGDLARFHAVGTHDIYK